MSFSSFSLFVVVEISILVYLGGGGEANSIKLVRSLKELKCLASKLISLDCLEAAGTRRIVYLYVVSS